MKVRPVGADLFHADGRTDRQDEAKSNLSLFSNAPKMEQRYLYGFQESIFHKFEVWELADTLASWALTVQICSVTNDDTVTWFSLLRTNRLYSPSREHRGQYNGTRADADFVLRIFTDRMTSTKRTMGVFRSAI
jgi:hypothetical protein